LETEFTVTLDEDTARELEQLGLDKTAQEKMVEWGVRDRIRDAHAQAENARIREVEQNLQETQTEEERSNMLQTLWNRAHFAAAKKATRATAVRVNAGPAGPTEAGRQALEQAIKQTARTVVEEYLQRVATRMSETGAAEAGQAVDDVLHQQD
jgi:hypothetical protein